MPEEGPMPEKRRKPKKLPKPKIGSVVIKRWVPRQTPPRTAVQEATKAQTPPTDE